MSAVATALIKGIGVWDAAQQDSETVNASSLAGLRCIRTIIRVADKVQTQGNFVTGAKAASESGVCVVDTLCC